ncbi:MAG: hypothetical protein EB060_09380 [Proteobacteria bacterium]|nr:hypothetical protein [Pseudomonadota bacterium]
MIPINATNYIAVPPAPLVAATSGASEVPPRFIADGAVRAITPANIPLAIVANENRGVQAPAVQNTAPKANNTPAVPTPAPTPSAPSPAVFIGNSSFLAQLLTQGNEITGTTQYANASRAYRSTAEQARRNSLQQSPSSEDVAVQNTSEEELHALSLVA